MSNSTLGPKGTATGTAAGGGIWRSLAVGLLVSLACAVVWGVIVDVTHYKVGFVAIGIGFLVGVAMARTAIPSRGLAPTAAVLALLGCLAGDVLVDANAVAQAFDLSTTDALTRMLSNPSLLVDVFKVGFEPMDALFWALAAFTAFRQVSAAVAVATARDCAPTAIPQVTGPQLSDHFSPAKDAPTTRDVPRAVGFQPTSGTATEPPVA